MGNEWRGSMRSEGKLGRGNDWKWVGVRNWWLRKRCRGSGMLAKEVRRKGNRGGKSCEREWTKRMNWGEWNERGIRGVKVWWGGGVNFKIFFSQLSSFWAYNDMHLSGCMLLNATPYRKSVTLPCGMTHTVVALDIDFSWTSLDWRFIIFLRNVGARSLYSLFH